MKTQVAQLRDGSSFSLEVFVLFKTVTGATKQRVRTAVFTIQQ